MRPFNLLLIFLLLAAAVLAACTTAGTTTDTPAPTEAITPAPPEAEEDTPTAEAATATAEPPPATATTETAEPTATVEPTATTVPAAFCPEIARPALILFLPGDQLLLFDPASGESCALPVPGRFIGTAELTDSAFFSPAPSATAGGDALVIQRFRSDGAVEDLPYTLIDAGTGASYTGFAVSPDERLIAWGVIGPTAGSALPSTSLSVADLETGEVVTGVTVEAGEQTRALAPIRFDEATNTLFYALQPYGLGGSWIAFNGRYDNLYAIAGEGGGEPELIFDCAEKGLFLCLGDFFVVDGAVTGLAYVDPQAGTVVIENGAGEVINTLQTDAEYAGYPTWGPSGELVYYTADIDDDSGGAPMPAMGNLLRVAPPTAPAETLVSDPALALPIEFLDDTRVIVNWVTEAETGLWGLALAGVDGSLEMLETPTGATVAGVVR